MAKYKIEPIKKENFIIGYQIKKKSFFFSSWKTLLNKKGVPRKYLYEATAKNYIKKLKNG